MVQSVGCLLIGNSGVQPEQFCRSMAAAGVRPVVGCWRGNLLSDMQRELWKARRDARRTCILAQGEMWAAALALAVQLDVDRVALIEPAGRLADLDAGRRRQLERLKSYARRNLFICVADVLILESPGRFRAEPSDVFGRLVNARVWRMQAEAPDKMYGPIAEFMLCEDFEQSGYV